MSLENIEEYLKDVQAIKYYDTVKAERDELQKKNEEIEKAFQLKRNELVEMNNTLLRERDSLYEEVVKLRTENERTEKTIEGLTNELNKKSKEASNLNARIAELESLKVTAEGRSLKEVEEAFVKAKNEEIQKEAEEHFNFMKIGWEQDKKPTEVLNAACNLLERSLKDGLWIKELAEKGVPEAVIKIISNEVSSRINQEFIRRVEEESDKKALTKLNQLTNVEWPNWVRTHVEPISRKLESKIVTNSLKLLEGPWAIPCDKCMSQQNVVFNVEGISQLLRNKYIHIECVNPNCRDFIGRHKIKVELGKLIYYYLTQG